MKQQKFHVRKNAMSDISKQPSITYAHAGVNINAGDALVDRIAPFVASTDRLGAQTELGGFAAFFDFKKLNYKDPLLLSTTDGVGTKLKLAFAANKHDTIGIDLVAMNVNDLIVHGGQPLFFLDYFATGTLHVDMAAQVIKGIADGCRIAGCALTGGETAEMPGMYVPGEYDLAGFCVGIVERAQVLPKKDTIKIGDVVIGLASSGIHSNGYSLVRFLLEKNHINIMAKPHFTSKYNSLIDDLLEPTKIYVQSLLPLIKNNQIKALAHITGGGLLENIPRVLTENVAVELDINSWKIPPIFEWLAHIGNIQQYEMLRTFNMGIGMVAIVDAESAQDVCSALVQAGEMVYVIGTVVPLHIKDKKQVIIKK
jgi:phosphoribosylaminoimidazole synthetase